MAAGSPRTSEWVAARVRTTLAFRFVDLGNSEPKQSPTIRFCSTIVHGLAKPKPLRIHVMASTPWMDRGAVLKLRKPPTRGMFFFSRKWSLSIPCWRCFVTWWTGSRASRPSFRAAATAPGQVRARSGPMRSGDSSPGGEQDAHRLALLVAGRVQVAPRAPDPDAGLVDADGPAMRLAERPRPALDQRRVGQPPAVHGAMVDLEAALEQQHSRCPGSSAGRPGPTTRPARSASPRRAAPCRPASGASVRQRWRTGSRRPPDGKPRIRSASLTQRQCRRFATAPPTRPGSQRGRSAG